MTQLNPISAFRRRRARTKLDRKGRELVCAAGAGLYVAGGTTWRCVRCDTVVMDDGEGMSCLCDPAKHEALPLEPIDPDFYSRIGMDPPSIETEEDELTALLANQVEILTAIVERQSEVTKAARHLMHVIAMRGVGGPVFQLRQDQDDDCTSEDLVNLVTLRHAVLDLQAKLDGTEPPEFCLPAPEEIH